ncbi:MAG: type IX secretion system membrane protein PorP/SprF [Bacteroidia bacterium]|nr:type IX secretion system membrane protein PorP/SprF [Bacteroidia bacterium]
MSKHYLLLLFVLCLTINTRAQNDLHFSHYMFNTVYYNPAAAGNKPTLEANITARKQWVGFNGAPTLGFLNVHTYIDKVKGGVGLSLVNDRLGFENITGIKGMYSYHIKLKEGHILRGGLSMGILYTSIDVSKFVFDTPGDNLASSVPKAKVAFDPNFGLEYANKYVTVGASSTHVLQGGKNATVFNMPRHYFIYVLGDIPVNEDWKILPSVLTKSTNFITQYEISALTQYKRIMWIGGTYRKSEALTALLGYYINDNFKVGYGYDFTGISKFRAYSNGTHEIMLSYTPSKQDQKKYHIKTPRFFN